MTRSAIERFRRGDGVQNGSFYDREISYRFARRRTAEMTRAAKTFAGMPPQGGILQIISVCAEKRNFFLPLFVYINGNAKRCPSGRRKRNLKTEVLL